MNVSLACAVNTHQQRANIRENAAVGQCKRALNAVTLHLHGSKYFFAYDLGVL